MGQGDAVLVQGRRGAVLVDAGTALPDGPDLGATVVVPALRALGVERLDLVVASHADLDHRGGLPAVLAALPVARLWLPHGGLRDAGFAELLAAARRAGVAVEEQGAGGRPLRAGDLAVVPLWPPRDPRAPARNDRSLTLRIEVAGRRVLLPGDLEADAEARLLAAGGALRAEILKLGHHGSRTSSSAMFLDAVAPRLAWVQAGYRNRFGHPADDVLQRYAERGVEVVRSDRCGAWRWRAVDDAAPTCERERARRYWHRRF